MDRLVGWGNKGKLTASSLAISCSGRSSEPAAVGKVGAGSSKLKRMIAAGNSPAVSAPRLQQPHWAGPHGWFARFEAKLGECSRVFFASRLRQPMPKQPGSIGNSRLPAQNLDSLSDLRRPSRLCFGEALSTHSVRGGPTVTVSP